MEEKVIQFDLIPNNSSQIKVIGVGGGGGNAVNHMFSQGIADVDYILCNTDAQVLALSPVPVKVNIGTTLTEGLGAGKNPEKGRQAAIENIDDIMKAIGSHTKMLFITAGMGGGTGTGAAPVIAQTSKEGGILTVAIVTLPFKWEGASRIEQAITGLDELSKHVDSLLVINNEKIREIYGNLKYKEGFAKANEILTKAAKGIAEIVTVPGYINVDFNDVKTIMANSGVAVMGYAAAGGPDRAMEAIKAALSSPLLSTSDITGAKNVLLKITSGSDEITIDEITSINEYISSMISKDARNIWGLGRDESLGDNISVTIIATGFTTDVIPELYARRMQSSGDAGITIPSPMSSVYSEQQHHSVQTTMSVMDIQEENMGVESQKIITGNIDVEKAAERIRALKQTKRSGVIKEFDRASYKKNIEEYSTVPAYVRSLLKTDDDTNIKEKKLSSTSLFDSDEKKTQLRPDNSYLHDNVD